MEERNKEMIKSPPDKYLKYNNYSNKKTNNLVRSHTQSHDYKSPRNYPYKNGNIMNNYDNFELNLINDKYDNEINYYNKDNSIKMNIIQNDYNNNILSKSSNNYTGAYSYLFMNKKNNILSNNIRINKASKEFSILKDSQEGNNEINMKYFDKNNRNSKNSKNNYNSYNNGMRSKTKSKSKYQSTSNVYSNDNVNRMRNKSAKNNIKYNKYYNNELIENMDKYNGDDSNNNFNLEERYFIKYLNNKIEKNKNGNFSGAKSYSNINKNYFYDSINKNKNNNNEYYREYLNNNSLSLKNIKTYKNNDNDNLIYNKKNKNKNIQDINGINFNNINIGINNNNFIIDNDRGYQTYNGSFRSKTMKVNNNEILEINDIKEEDILKSKIKNPINARNEFIKRKYIIETEEDRLTTNNNNRNISKPKNINENLMKNNNLYYINNTSDDKDINYKMSISENIYRMPLNYSQSIPNNNGSNKYGTNIELKNYLKNTKTFKNSSNNKAFSIKKIKDKNNNNINNNYGLYEYNEKANNMYDNPQIKNNSKNYVTNPVIKNRDNDHNPFNTIYKSQRIYKYDNGIDNPQMYSTQYRNNNKNEKINNKNNLDINHFKGNNHIDYHKKLDLIKNRTKNLLNLYSKLLKQQTIFNINESMHNNTNNH